MKKRTYRNSVSPLLLSNVFLKKKLYLAMGNERILLHLTATRSKWKKEVFQMISNINKSIPILRDAFLQIHLQIQNARFLIFFMISSFGHYIINHDGDEDDPAANDIQRRKSKLG
jgi:hypothetical protein